MGVDSFEQLRFEMVARQMEQRGLDDPRLLAVMRGVPRHLFVPEDLRDKAYDDYPLAIGNGQTISQPYIVALMTDLLNLHGGETILEIGTGSGYQAAVLASLANCVVTIERYEVLAWRARQVLAELSYLNVQVHTGDGALGWPAAAPFQGILVTAAAPSPPLPLLEQLADGGRLVLPVGGRSGQTLQVWQRIGTDFQHEDVIPVAFVPLRGKYGWDMHEWEENSSCII